jgi:hypothetical protein
MKKALSTIILVFVAYIGFAINTMFAPTLVAPVNNAVNQMPNAFMNWSAVPGAFYYKIQISTDSLFGVSKSYSTNLTAINTSNLLFNTKYFWRVKAIGVNDSSDWTTVYAFYTIKTVTIVKPGDSSTNRTVSAYFRWNAISGLTGYEYQMDTSLSFASPLFVTSIVSGTKTEAYSKQLAFGEHYYLRMRAKHADDISAWSDLVNFWTLTDLATVNPVNNDTTLHMPVTTLEWEWVGSKFYEYAIATDSFFTSPMIYTFDTTKVIKSALDTIIRVNTDTLLFGQKYYWKVRAKNALDTSNWSSFSAFTTLDKMTLISPENGTIDVPTYPTFTWDSLKNIGYYILEIDKNTSFTTAQSFVLPNTIDTYTLATLSPLQNSTPYYWRMRTLTLVDTSNWSDTFMFTTISPAGIENSVLDNNSVSIYPNPSLNGRINIQITSSNNQPVNASLMNMIGQEVYSQILDVKSGNNTFSMDLSNKDNGIYFLKLHNSDNSLTRKIILNK